MAELNIARHQLDHGNEFPYDGGSDAVPASDWAHTAARGILADLLDRRGIKWELEKVEHDVRVDIVTALANIVRAAAPSTRTAANELPPLPKPDKWWREDFGLGDSTVHEGHSDEQMRAYGQECARAALSANAADREAKEFGVRAEARNET